MKFLQLITFLLSFTMLQSHGQDYSQIDRKDLKRFVKILASDSLRGRATASEGQRKAAAFISARFKELQLQSSTPTPYLEAFTLKQTYWGDVYLKTKDKTLKNFEHMVFQGSDHQNEERERQVVFAGRGTEEELDDLEIAGTFVFVFVKNLRGNYELNRRIQKRKAAGLILANPENDKQFEVLKNTLKDYALQKRLSLPESDTVVAAPWDTLHFINTICIPNSEIKTVTGIGERELMKRMAEHRINDLPTLHVKTKFERVQHETETANVVGTIKGTTSKSIVISAHYDHLGESDHAYFPGADDNASGTAALLELAQAFTNEKDLPYNLIFLATTGEEAGLLGSSYHVNQSGFNPSDIIINLNLDMIGRKDEKHPNGKYLYCIGSDQSEEMQRVIARADSLSDQCTIDYALNNSKEPAGLFTRSDNYSFYKKGITAIHFFSGLHADYHKPTDTADKIDFVNLENRVKLIAKIIDLLQHPHGQN